MTPEFTRSRSMPLLLAPWLLAIGSLAAHAQSSTYTVEIRPTLNDLDIKIEHVAQASTLVVNLTNNSPTRVRCNLRFDASPQTPVRRTRHIDPGRTDSSVLRAQRRWFSVTVDVECVPAPR
jgi:hypothetical protein